MTLNTPSHCVCVLFLQTNGGPDQFEQWHIVPDQCFHHNGLLMCKSNLRSERKHP